PPSDTLSLHDALPIFLKGWEAQERADAEAQRQIRREIARAQARSGALPGPAPERARAVAFPAPPRRLSEDQARSVMAEAIAVTQDRKSTRLNSSHRTI